VTANSKRLSLDPVPLTAEASTMRAILDDLTVGIVLLDNDYRVQFVNRAFRQVWRIPDALADSRPSFVDLLYQGRGTKASSVSHRLLGYYSAMQMDLIRTGEEQPLQIRLSNGDGIQFRCKALADGGRLLTYGNVSELTRQADALERLATTDAMTGVHNRRHFLNCAENEWDRHKRYDRSLAVLMIDIDRFKSINDQYGHDAGDVVIKAVSETLRKHKRAHDIVGRLGGEEFALLLLEATLDNAVAAAERLRQLVADRAVVVDKVSIAVTVSIGAAVSRADVSGVHALLKEADVALYEAKRSGRNRVCRFDPSRST
jgi:diguanylate cyclase (GGDEF)-like protein